MDFHWISFVCALFYIRVYGTSDENGIPLNPCPDIFQYGYDNAKWFGYIQIKVLPSVEVTKLEVVLSLPTDTKLESEGSLELLRTSKNSIKDIQNNKPVWYRVHFPLQNQIPELSKILVNGQIVCSGGQENGAIIRLEHTLFTDDSKNPQASILQTSELMESLTVNSSTPPEVSSIVVDNITVNPQNTSTRVYQPELIQQAKYQSQQLQNQFDSQNTFEAKNQFESQNQFEPQNQLEPQNKLEPQNQFELQNQFDPQKRFEPHSQYENHQTGPLYHLQNESQQVYQPKSEHQPRFTEPQHQSQSQQADNISHSEKEMCGKIAERFENTKNVSKEISFRGGSPWLVTFYIRHGAGLIPLCFGNLVSSKIVVTAANCFNKSNLLVLPDDIVIIFGRHNFSNWFEDGLKIAQVQKLVVHEDYAAKHIENNDDGITLYNANIALAIMQEKVQFTDFIRPICLWEGSSNLDYLVGTLGTVVSWSSTGSEPSIFSISIVSDAACLRSNYVYQYFTSKRSFCAVRGPEPCGGELGNGMIMLRNGRWFLRGIEPAAVETKPYECNFGEYFIYTDVAKFVSWIRSHEKF